jgi:hypothetical protein
MFNYKVSEEQSTNYAIELHCKISHCRHAMRWLLSDRYIFFQFSYRSVAYVISSIIPCIVVNIEIPVLYIIKLMAFWYNCVHHDVTLKIVFVHAFLLKSSFSNVFGCNWGKKKLHKIKYIPTA